MPRKTHPDWPVLTSYDRDHLERIALPLGGIGTGTVSLGGRGDLRSWEIVNRPAKHFAPRNAFFALYAKAAGEDAVTRCIEADLPAERYEGAMGASARNHGLPRFRKAEFHAAYPLGQVVLSDSDVPVDVRIEAFNPLVPPDADASGIPVAVLRFVLVNRTTKNVTAAVCGSLANFIGTDGSGGRPGFADKVDHTSQMRGNANRVRKTKRLRGVYLQTESEDTHAEQWGSIALATTSKTGVSCRTDWPAGRWSGGLLDFWDDFSDDGALEPRPSSGAADPMASLAVRTRVPAGGEKAITFLLCWHFPNRYTWTPKAAESGACCGDDPNRIGNYYTEQYRDAWDVAVKTADELKTLEKGTVEFVRAFCEADLPHAVREAALYNLSSFRSQTVFRTPDGRMFGWEGCCDTHGCCYGSCTHVWNYEQATAHLFGPLARTMREVEFAHATRDDGHMSFRVNLPLERATEMGVAAADGQMGCLMKLYRDWRLSGDDEMLRALYPKAKKALEFCWIPGGWDGDVDGVMEGCQHNTMDVEYFGPNGQMQGWYLGALRATEEMARGVGDDEFADRCRELFQRGSEWMDGNLFNGEYYEHEIRAPKSADDVADGLRSQMGAENPGKPDFQLGKACLVDQLVGQYMAHVCGLGYLLKPANVRRTLRSIYKYNFRKDFHGHFNHMRSFVLNDERALLMATYPHGDRPKYPFPYFTEVMTGFEYTAAVGMLQEGQTARGLECIEAIRDRYDGRKRSPFDEAECGHHYARAMASWAAMTTLTGFRYDGVTRSIEFAAAEGPATWFWSTGDAWGTVSQKPTADAVRVELTVRRGALPLERVTIAGVGTAKARTLRAGRTARLKVERQ